MFGWGSVQANAAPAAGQRIASKVEIVIKCSLMDSAPDEPLARCFAMRPSQARTMHHQWKAGFSCDFGLAAGN
jgi:hypothetical protein